MRLRRAITLLLIYAAYVAGPGLHEFGQAMAQECAPCQAAHAAGPAFTTHCPAPCDDPTHHHHPGHDPHHCPVCQAGLSGHVPAESDMCGTELSGNSWLRPCLHGRASLDRRIAPDVPRGPPVLVSF